MTAAHDLPDVYTSRWADRELARLSCVPVGISRGVPKFPLGYRYRLVRELAPSRATFALEDTQAFAVAYRAGLDELGLQTILGRLGRVADQHPGKPLCLLCFEPVGQFCHRHLLADWLRERGVPIRELRPGDLPRRHDVPEPTLF